YGFDHSGSDRDTFTVTTSRATRAEHAITGANDSLTVGLNRFLWLAMSGSHQAVEALYSPVKAWGRLRNQYQPLIESVSGFGGDGFEKYERTTRKFCYGDFKRRRHAVRLAFNLTELRQNGRLESSRLTQTQIIVCNRTAQMEDDELARNLGVYKEAE